MTSQPLLDEREAATLLRLTPARVARLAKRGVLPHVRLPGDEVRFIETDLQRWIEAHRQPGGAVQ